MRIYFYNPICFSKTLNFEVRFYYSRTSLILANDWETLCKLLNFVYNQMPFNVLCCSMFFYILGKMSCGEPCRSCLSFIHCGEGGYKVIAVGLAPGVC